MDNIVHDVLAVQGHTGHGRLGGVLALDRNGDPVPALYKTVHGRIFMAVRLYSKGCVRCKIRRKIKEDKAVFVRRPGADTSGHVIHRDLSVFDLVSGLVVHDLDAHLAAADPGRSARSGSEIGADTDPVIGRGLPAAAGGQGDRIPVDAHCGIAQAVALGSDIGPVIVVDPAPVGKLYAVGRGLALSDQIPGRDRRRIGQVVIDLIGLRDPGRGIVVFDPGDIPRPLDLKGSVVIRGQHGIEHDPDSHAPGLRTGIDRLVFNPDTVIDRRTAADRPAGNEFQLLRHNQIIVVEIHGRCRDIVFIGDGIGLKDPVVSIDVQERRRRSRIRIAVDQLPPVVAGIVGISLFVSD